MKIIMVSDEVLWFDNGNKITYDHDQDCCEFNYADFDQLESEAWDYDFKEPLLFEKVDGAGFRFGDQRRMFFIPCYSSQNGYYTTDLDIYYNNRLILNLSCEEDFA